MVLATLDVSLHIGIYLLVYIRHFNIPFSNMEYRIFVLFSGIVPFGYDDFYMYIQSRVTNIKGLIFIVVIFISQY